MLIYTRLSTCEVNFTVSWETTIFCLLCLLFFDLQSFITQDSSDRDFLVKNLQSFDVPILNYVRDESGRKAPFEISKQVPVSYGQIQYFIQADLSKLMFVLCFLLIGQMHELGIYSRLDQVFDAPTAVKEVLTSQFGLEHSVCLKLPWSTYIFQLNF